MPRRALLPASVRTVTMPAVPWYKVAHCPSRGREVTDMDPHSPRPVVRSARRSSPPFLTGMAAAFFLLLLLIADQLAAIFISLVGIIAGDGGVRGASLLHVGAPAVGADGRRERRGTAAAAGADGGRARRVGRPYSAVARPALFRSRDLLGHRIPQDGHEFGDVGNGPRGLALDRASQFAVVRHRLVGAGRVDHGVERETVVSERRPLPVIVALGQSLRLLLVRRVSGTRSVYSFTRTNFAISARTSGAWKTVLLVQAGSSCS